MSHGVLWEGPFTGLPAQMAPCREVPGPHTQLNPVSGEILSVQVAPLPQLTPAQPLISAAANIPPQKQWQMIRQSMFRSQRLSTEPIDHVYGQVLVSWRRTCSKKSQLTGLSNVVGGSKGRNICYYYCYVTHHHKSLSWCSMCAL